MTSRRYIFPIIYPGDIKETWLVSKYMTQETFDYAHKFLIPKGQFPLHWTESFASQEEINRVKSLKEEKHKPRIVKNVVIKISGENESTILLSRQINIPYSQ